MFTSPETKQIPNFSLFVYLPPESRYPRVEHFPLVAPYSFSSFSISPSFFFPFLFPSRHLSRAHIQARTMKHLGDLFLLCGQLQEANAHYRVAANNLKSHKDFLWLGAAYEGQSVTAILMKKCEEVLGQKAQGTPLSKVRCVCQKMVPFQYNCCVLYMFIQATSVFMYSSKICLICFGETYPQANWLKLSTSFLTTKSSFHPNVVYMKLEINTGKIQPLLLEIHLFNSYIYGSLKGY